MIERKVSTSRGPLYAALVLQCGVLLLALSFLWRFLPISHGTWTDQQARDFQSAAAKLHSLSHEYAQKARSGETADVARELKEAEATYNNLRTDLDAAVDHPRRSAFYLRVIGAVLTALGGFALYRSRAAWTES